jgi:type IV pilus assembly protein PilO
MALSLKDSLQKMPAKTRTVAFIVIVGLVFGSFVYFFRIPMSTEIKGLEKVIAEKKAIIAQNDERIRKLDELRARVRELNEQLKVMKEKLPAENEVSSLLRQIQNEVNKSGLTLKLWKPDKRKPHESGLYEEIPITVNLIGGYHNFGVFLDRVSKLPRIVNIQNFKMDSAKMDPSGSVNINISCTAMTFAATEKKVEATPAPKAATKKVQ